MSVWTMPLPGLMRKKAGGLNVADVFKTTLYTGNGTVNPIINGLNMLDRGALLWTKNRVTGLSHGINDSERATTEYYLSTNNSNSEGNTTCVDFFKSDGYQLSGADSWYNASGSSYVSWSYCEAPKFFDIVTYTGNGASGRQIAHGLGVTPGFVTTKSLSTTGDWNSYHRSATGDLILNSSAAQAGSRSIITAADATSFTVSGAANTNGVTYVAYPWAHDPSPGGIIQCGSYTGNGSSSGPTINLGWQPQYILIKNATATGDWQILDTTRGMISGNDQILLANTAGAETSVNLVAPNSSGFQIVSTASNVNSNGATYIYMAIIAEGV